MAHRRLSIKRITKQFRERKKYSAKYIFKRFLRIFAYFCVAGIIAIAILFVWFAKDLPTPSKIAKKINIPSTQILDRNGELLYAVSGEKKRLVVPLTQLPDSLKKATVAIEDQNFYKHHGLDFKGIARSILIDIWHGSARQGGSTITQQFVKNALLTSKKQVSRKIKELILAIELEAIYPKDKILELYLNEIPYGTTAYGAEAASRTYFAKPAKDLTLAESAALAALPQAPTRYSPYGEHKDLLLKRKDFVLDKMLKLSMISQKEADDAKKQEIVFVPRRDSILAPHFVFYIQQLIADKYGEEMLQNGGLKVTTTLDLKIQKMAEEAVAAGVKKLDQYDANNAALVSVEPKTGQIIAMVGSKDYFDQGIQGQVNVTLANRQPGSSFKPIVYSTAFKGKYNPAYPLFDLSTDFGGGYRPSNYDNNTHGPLSMRTALSNSLNIPAVKTLALVGVDEAIKTAQDLGITTLTEPDKYGLSLVLGAGEVKPLEMAGAFGAFGNEGKFNKPTPLLKVTDQDGKILEEYKTPENKEMLNPQVAYLISDVLSDNESRKMVFGFTKMLSLPNRRAAVKTGTTTAFKDAWTIGYTPQLSTAVWVGNTNNKPMKRGADGSVLAAPIWNNFMKKYHENLPVLDFIKPDGIQTVTVDFLSNKLPDADSPEADRRRDIFASWSAPKDKDDIHIKVKINKTNGQLATDQTPPELIEEKTYTNAHSEMPNNPSWENPVREWARANNIDNLPPTGQDDQYSSIEQHPAVSITSPENNANISDEFTIKANAAAHYGIKSVDFLIDDSVIKTMTSEPYEASANNDHSLSVGSHKITVRATDQNDIKGDASITIQIAPAVIAPTISEVSATTTAATVLFTWVTSSATTGSVEYGTTTSLGSSGLTESTYATTHTITLGGLSAGTQYYYKITVKEKSGTGASSEVGTFTTK